MTNPVFSSPSRRHVLQLTFSCSILKGGTNKLIEQGKDHKIENSTGIGIFIRKMSKLWVHFRPEFPEIKKLLQ